MKQTTTLENVKKLAVERRKTLSQEVVSVKSMLMDPAQPGRMIIRRPGSTHEDSYAFDDRCYAQAPGVVYGLPGAYLQKLVEDENGDPQLAALNFNHWVGVSKEREALLLFKQGEEGQRVIRSILPSTWHDIPYDATIDTLITKFGPDKEVQLTYFNEDRIVIDMITKRLDIPESREHRAIDDPIEWGVRIKDSDSGMCDLTIAPYTLRLRCTNGATTMTTGIVMKVPHKGKQAAVLEAALSNVRQGVEMMESYSSQVVAQIEASQGIVLDLDEKSEPSSTLVRIAKDTVMNRLQDKYVREAWHMESQSIPIPSVYRLFNAMTRAGTHGEELTENDRLHLQAVGGRVLELSTQKYTWN